MSTRRNLMAVSASFPLFQLPLQLFRQAGKSKLACSLAVCAAGSVNIAAAQTPEHTCGSSVDPTNAAALYAQELAGAYRLPIGVQTPPPGAVGTTRYVPLTFHVVRESDGSGGIAMAQLDAALQDANNHFAAMGVQFCLNEPILYIDDDAFYFDIDTDAELSALRNTNLVPNTINCYFTEELANSSFALCGISSFTTSTDQAIAMRNSCTGLPSNPSTFSHEIGHYFDLYHTHEPFFGIECVNGSNCNTAGDLVCDTPADPQIGFFNVDAGCNYTGSSTDSCNNQSFSPLTSNIMSYSRATCRDQFTSGQNARGLATLLNLRPELVRPFCTAGIEYFCDPAQANSTGQPTSMQMAGSGVASDNALTLRATNMPLNQFGYFLNADTDRPPVMPSGSQGDFCLGGVLGRFNRPGEIGWSGSTGEIELLLDLTDIPTSLGSITLTAGQTYYFQAWHRDLVGGTSTNNFSNVMSIKFL